jgi:hypothetical protein
MSNKQLTHKLNSTTAAHNRQQGYLPLRVKTCWDNFPADAQSLVKRLGAQVISRDIGADLYHWRIDFEATKLGLFYEDTSESCWLELEHHEEQDVLDFIASLLGNEYEL